MAKGKANANTSNNQGNINKEFNWVNHASN